MPKIKISLFSIQEIQTIHDASLKILRDVGMVVHHAGVLQKLRECGARVEPSSKLARFDETMVMNALQQAGKQFTFHGRNPKLQRCFGAGECTLMSSPGQYAWFDYHTNQRRDPVLADAVAAAKVGELLPNIGVVGAMCVPLDVPAPVRDVVLMAEMVKVCAKPLRCWPVTRRSSHYVLEICAAVAGGKGGAAPESDGRHFRGADQPAAITGNRAGRDAGVPGIRAADQHRSDEHGRGSGPVTLAGTLAQENAEILAGIMVIQCLKPGTPVMYGGIPHIMDPRTSICSFGSAEQGLMAVAMTEIGKSYGLPVYINVNLSDAKRLDVQAGMEKMGSLELGMLAGADLFGHAGIVGTDHGGSLTWLAVDNEAFAFAQRMARGFEVDAESLALEVIEAVGPGGNYLSEAHTVRHLRSELWAPSQLWTRQTYDGWLEAGGKDMEQRAIAEIDRMLARHPGQTIEPGLALEIDRIVGAAKKELL